MDSTNKKFIMIFSITFIVCVVVVIVALVFLLPKQYSTLNGSINAYEAVDKANYSYEATKDIEENSLVRDYTITSEELQNFRRRYQYVVGNNDPFTPLETEEEEEEDE